MDWKKKLCRLPGRMTKENWIVLLCLGLILMVVAVPLSGKNGEDKGSAEMNRGNGSQTVADRAGAGGLGEISPVPQTSPASYEAVLENRVKEVLKKVEGVGAVDVLIVLKSSEEKVYRTDGKTSQSSTKEMDSAGGSREVIERQEEVSTVLSGSGGSALGSGGSGNEALLEKELYPELSGIIISAQGGGSPTVKAEITEAMEALFGLPAHKIKVLKRVE